MVWTGGAQGNLAPSLIALFDQADDLYPLRDRASDGTLGDAAHASRDSDHNPKPPNPPGWVDAGDLTRDDIHGPDIPALWDRLIATRDHRVKYLIHRGRIVKSYVDGSGRAAWVPQVYTGTSPHAHHMHISVLPTQSARHDTSPWFSQEDDMPLTPADIEAVANAVILKLDATVPEGQNDFRKSVYDTAAAVAALSAADGGGATTGTFQVTGQLSITDT